MPTEYKTPESGYDSIRDFALRLGTCIAIMKKEKGEFKGMSFAPCDHPLIDVAREGLLNVEAELSKVITEFLSSEEKV